MSLINTSFIRPRDRQCAASYCKSHRLAGWLYCWAHAVIALETDR